MAVVTLHDVPGNHIDLLSFADVAANAATNYILVWYVPFNCYVISVKIAFTDSITGTDTDSFNFNLDDNDRSTELANKDYASGTDAVAGTEVSLYAPTAPGKSLSTGNNLYLERELVGTNGLATPAGTLIITYTGR